QVRLSKIHMKKFVGQPKKGNETWPTGLSKRYKLAQRSVLGLVLLYLIFVLPYTLYVLTYVDSRYVDIGIILYSLYTLQYVGNTLIYVVSNHKFRIAYREFFRWLRQGGCCGCGCYRKNIQCSCTRTLPYNQQTSNLGKVAASVRIRQETSVLVHCRYSQVELNLPMQGGNCKCTNVDMEVSAQGILCHSQCDFTFRYNQDTKNNPNLECRMIRGLLR
ncbi:unnamed protein product, partial [Meganyctiphanes norvegica]